MLGTGATAEDWRSILGQWHGLAVSVPVGLLVAVVVAEFIAFVQRDAGSRLLRTALWICTAIAAALAVITGLLLAGDGGGGSEAAARHTTLGLVLAGMLVAVAVADVSLPRRARVLAAGIRVGGLGAATALLGIVALLGVTMADGPDALRGATPARLQGLLAPVERLAPTPVLARPTPASAPIETPTPTRAPAPPPATVAIPHPAVLELDLAELGPGSMAAILEAAAHVRTLRIRGIAADPIALAALPAFPAVHLVRLDDPSVDDATAITILTRTPAAREVLLHDASVTTATLPAVVSLEHLERVSVWATALDTPPARARCLDQRPLLTWIGTPDESVRP